MLYVEGMIFQFEFLKTAHSDGVRFMLHIVEYSFRRERINGSEYGQPKLLLYERPPTGMANCTGLRQIATFPMSMGNSPSYDY